VAITLGDSAVPIVDNQLGALVAADLPSPVDGVLLIMASCLLSKWPEERLPPPFLISHPPKKTEILLFVGRVISAIHVQDNGLPGAGMSLEVELEQAIREAA